MTSRTRPSRLRFATRSALLLLLSVTAGGCGAMHLLHRGPSAAAPPRATAANAGAKTKHGRHAAAPAPAPAAPADPVAEARAQAALAPADPYGPYHVAELVLPADTSAAERALRESLARDAGYAPALSLLSKLDFQAGRHQEAVTMLETARSRGAALPREVLVGLALHYDALGRTDQARTVLESLPESDREREATPVVYVMLRGPTPDSAAALARAAVHRDPHSAVCQNNYGITRLRAGDPRGAREAFAKAIGLDASLPGPYYNLAILEKFYALDDSAAAHWYRLYHDRSADDPDGLARLFEPAAPGQGLASKKD